MKKSSLILLLSLYSTVSFSNIGVISKNGIVQLFNTIEDRVVLKNCAAYTTLGETAAEANQNCKGQEFKLHTDFFKAHLKKITALRLDLNPLTREEIVAINSITLTNEELVKLKTELKAINDHIAQYGEASANMARKKEIENRLKLNEDKPVAINKENLLVEKLLADMSNKEELFIIDNTGIELIGYNNVALGTFKYSRDLVTNQNCGTNGNLENRLKDCARFEDAFAKDMLLVTRIQKDGLSIWLDPKNSKVWMNADLKIKEGDHYLQADLGAKLKKMTKDEFKYFNEYFPQRYYYKSYMVGDVFKVGSVKPYEGHLIDRHNNRQINFKYKNGEVLINYFKDNVEMISKKLSIGYNPQDSFVSGDSSPYQYEILNASPIVANAIFVGCAHAIDMMAVMVCGPVVIATFVTAGALSPLDLLITKLDATLDREQRAMREFSKMASGKTEKVNSKVFDVIVDRISKM